MDPFMEFSRYDPGRVLTIAPYTPPEAYGLTGLAGTWPVSRPLVPAGFDGSKVKPSTLANLEVVKSLSGGIGNRAQVLLCKIVKRPNEEPKGRKCAPLADGIKPPLTFIVAKVFDPVLYPEPGPLDPPFDGDTLADQQVSREASVFEFCHKENMTGHPHIVPRYYGSWVAKLDNSTGGRPRFVSLILMEYVEGRTIERLCTRNEKTKFLDPKDGLVALHQDPEEERAGKLRKFVMNHDSRLKILAKVLDGGVKHFHKLIEHDKMTPENLIVTLRDSRTGKYYKEPHVFLVDFNVSTIWSATSEGKSNPDDLVLRLPKPPHPWERSSIEGLVQFIGWFPVEWTDKEYTTWLIKEFGPRNGPNDKYFTFPPEADQVYMPQRDLFKQQGQQPKPSHATGPSDKPSSSGRSGPSGPSGSPGMAPPSGPENIPPADSIAARQGQGGGPGNIPIRGNPTVGQSSSSREPPQRPGQGSRKPGSQGGQNPSGDNTNKKYHHPR